MERELMVARARDLILHEQDFSSMNRRFEQSPPPQNAICSFLNFSALYILISPQSAYFPSYSGVLFMKDLP